MLPGKASVDTTAGVAFRACGKSVYMLDLHSLRLSRVVLNITQVSTKGKRVPKLLRPHQALTALATWPVLASGAVGREWHIVLGTQYPPVVFAGILTASPAFGASATLVQAFDPKTLSNSSAAAASVEFMTVNALYRMPGSGNIACGLYVGNFFDGDLPAALYTSTDGSRSFHEHPNTHEIPNTNVHNFMADPRGRLCMATDGNGVVCVNDENVS